MPHLVVSTLRQLRLGSLSAKYPARLLLEQNIATGAAEHPSRYPPNDNAEIAGAHGNGVLPITAEASAADMRGVRGDAAACGAARPARIAEEVELPEVISGEHQPA